MTRPFEKLVLFLSRHIHSSWQTSLLRALLFQREPGRWRHAPTALHRFVCAVLVIVMSTQMVIASPEISHSITAELRSTSVDAWQNADHWWKASGWSERTARLMRENFRFLRSAAPQRKSWDGMGAPQKPMPRPKAQETQAGRNARVARVEVIPAEVTVKPDQAVEFIVIGYDANGAPVSSLPFEMSGAEENGGEQVKLTDKRKFAAAKEGDYLVKVNALGHLAEARVKVKSAPRALSDQPVAPRTYSSRDLPAVPRSTSSVQPNKLRFGRKKGNLAGQLASRYTAA
ncbi:MAG: hypothetical protein J2P31_16570, partial [Blastocatellia bacterium]|nr:hypothetical protein [Blastocatellia bacterium]